MKQAFHYGQLNYQQSLTVMFFAVMPEVLNPASRDVRSKTWIPAQHTAGMTEYEDYFETLN